MPYATVAFTVDQEGEMFILEEPLLAFRRGIRVNLSYAKLSQFRLAFVAFSFLAVTLFCNKLAVAQDTPLPALSQFETPTGPYASWSDDTKRKALAALTNRCTLVTTMRLGIYSGSREAGSEIFQAMSAWCVVNQMPDDWPERGKWLESRDIHLEAARKLDKTLQISPN